MSHYQLTEKLMAELMKVSKCQKKKQNLGMKVRQKKVSEVKCDFGKL